MPHSTPSTSLHQPIDEKQMAACSIKLLNRHWTCSVVNAWFKAMADYKLPVLLHITHKKLWFRINQYERSVGIPESQDFYLHLIFAQDYYNLN